jgi:hypothetical protein
MCRVQNDNLYFSKDEKEILDTATAHFVKIHRQLRAIKTICYSKLLLSHVRNIRMLQHVSWLHNAFSISLFCGRTEGVREEGGTLAGQQMGTRFACF